MYFIGSGSLLIRAVSHAFNKGIHVNGVFGSEEDTSLKRLIDMGVNVRFIKNPKHDLKEALIGKNSSVVFSINNKFLITDEILTSGHKFFNIHNGLVQKYRGIAEICILAAIKHKETNYGVTLHEILPNQNVDSGPLVDQINFDIKEQTFEGIIKQSFIALENIFELNLEPIISNKFFSKEVSLSNESYKYSDLEKLCLGFSGDEIKKIFSLGSLSVFFPKLKRELDSIIESRS